MKKETLLEKAKKEPYQRGLKIEITDEHIELALGWLKNEVSTTQIGKVLDIPTSGNILYRLAIWLKEAYRQGKIKIK